MKTNLVSFAGVRGLSIIVEFLIIADVRNPVRTRVCQPMNMASLSQFIRRHHFLDSWCQEKLCRSVYNTYDMSFCVLALMACKLQHLNRFKWTSLEKNWIYVTCKFGAHVTIFVNKYFWLNCFLLVRRVCQFTKFAKKVRKIREFWGET